jgi:hypothetical protein
MVYENLNPALLEERRCTYRHEWFQHVHGMEDNRLPKQLLNYHPKGRRRPGRPLKRLLDHTTAGTETGHLGLNSWRNMTIITLNLTSSCSWWLNDLTLRPTFVRQQYTETSEQCPSLATVRTDNASIIIFFPAVLFFQNLSLVSRVTVFYINLT